MSNSNKTINQPILNKFTHTYKLQQRMDTIHQQNVEYAKYDNYSTNGLDLTKEPGRPLNTNFYGGLRKEKILTNKKCPKNKLCKEAKKQIDNDMKICSFHQNDFNYRGKWKEHEIYVDTNDKKRAAKQIFFMFANQMNMKKFNYELINEKNGKKEMVKGYLDKNGKAELSIIKK